MVHGQGQRPSLLMAPLPLVAPRGAAVAVAIDVLRASSTAVVAHGRGAHRVLVASSLREARRLRRTFADHLLAGERGGLPPPGFDLGNSPWQALAADLRGRGLVLTTSNGTRLLRRLAHLPVVLVGCLLNRRAVATVAAAQARALGLPVALVCAGEAGGRELALEDVIGAGAIVETLLELGHPLEPDEWARLALLAFEAARRDLPSALAATRHGRQLAALGLGDDVAYCARLDEWEVVPRLERGAEGLLALRPCPLPPAR
ncbi:MAG TPA: 2-phosphosulfolactate phosphatase [Dehalococcoidia bacterium]|nr:2-phosphosulfolactate phosphatase [Dehalococcoidia bacterium]